MAISFTLTGIVGLGASPERDRFSTVRKLSSRELSFGFGS
jgi:hypothetical protein